jgi:CRP/FNR family transcriptional regulator, anaerobic regulatory protein
MDNAAFMLACPGGDRRAGRPPSNIAAVRPPQTPLTDLFADQVAERYTPPRAICWEGEPATHVFHLLEGCLRVCRTMEDGRRAILRFGYAGDLLSLSAIDTYPFTAEAVTPVRFRRLTRHRFADLVEADPDLRAQLHAEVCGEMRTAQDQIIRLGRTGADERVASFLLDVAQRAGLCMVAPVEIEIAFGRLDIADFLGLTVETISREISKLKHDGLISMDGPHRIVLRRMRRLREIARMDAPELYRVNKREPGISRHAITVAA